jgi:hypothetical protein
MSTSAVNDDSVSLDDLLVSELPIIPMFKSYDPTAYLQDSNSGVYNQNQIQWDTTPVTKNQWCDLHNALLYMPVTITLSVNTGASITGFGATLKYGGLLQMIDSLSVQVNGTSLTVNSRQNALYSCIRALDNYSSEGVQTQGDSFYLYPDTLDSWTMAISGTGACTAYTNWTVAGAFPSVAVATPNPSLWNQGLFNRCRLANLMAVAGGVTSNAQQLHISNYTTAGSVGTINIHGFARLRDLHPVFQAIDCPMKNFNAQIIANLNQVANCSPSGTALGAAATAGSIYGSSNPIQVTSQIQATTLCTVSCFVPAGSNTRLYIPQVVLPAEVEAQLPAGAFTIRKFNDFQVTSFNGAVAANSAINWNITSSVQNLKSVSICPFISGTTNLATPFSIYQAMTSAEPGIPGTPQVQLYNTQLYVNGLPVFRAQQQYLPETWLQVVSQSRLNDNHDSIFSSGVFGQYSWQRGFPGFLRYDCNRQTQGMQSPVTLNFQASNSTPFAIELLAVIEFEKVMRFEHNSGQMQVTAF